MHSRKYLLTNLNLQLKHIFKMDADSPDRDKLRRILFWYTKMKKINWIKMKRAVIQRVFERGKETEKQEIISFYEKEVVDDILELLKKK